MCGLWGIVSLVASECITPTISIDLLRLRCNNNSTTHLPFPTTGRGGVILPRGEHPWHRDGGAGADPELGLIEPDSVKDHGELAASALLNAWTALLQKNLMKKMRRQHLSKVNVPISEFRKDTTRKDVFRGCVRRRCEVAVIRMDVFHRAFSCNPV